MDFNSHELTFNCPSCGQEFSETVGRLRQNPNFPCVGCGASITIEADELDTALQALPEELDALGEQLKKLFE
ncbi:hypothetical protein JOS77_28940 [Chromobacterium haemolyticum]|nr:hypothetical protein JOS77_28940 [Chromobacterium haemolyticum]